MIQVGLYYNYNFQIRLIMVWCLIILGTGCTEPPSSSLIDQVAKADQEKDASNHELINATDSSLGDFQSDAGPLPVVDTLSLPDAAGNIPTCHPELSLSPLELSSPWCVVWRVDTKLDLAVEAFALNGTTYWAYMVGLNPSSFEALVYKNQIDLITGQPGKPVLAARFTSTSTAFPGEYLALSSNNSIAVGYTDSKLDGAIYWGDIEGKTLAKVKNATGNYDVVFLDEQTLLINGLGAENVQNGQGVYVIEQGKAPRRLIRDLGSISGHLALGQNVFFAGGYEGENQLYVFPLSTIKEAIRTGQVLSGSKDGVLVYKGGLIDIAVLGDDLVAVEAGSFYEFKSVSLMHVQLQNNTVSFSEEKENLVLADGTTRVKRVTTSGEQIGLLLWGPKGVEELAVIQRQ